MGDGNGDADQHTGNSKRKREPTFSFSVLGKSQVSGQFSLKPPNPDAESKDFTGANSPPSLCSGFISITTPTHLLSLSYLNLTSSDL